MRLEDCPIPFWELRRGGGPVTEAVQRHAASLRRCQSTPYDYSDLQYCQQRLFYLEHGRGSHDQGYEGERRSLRRRLQEMGADPLPRPMTAAEAKRAALGYSPGAVRFNGSDGEGCRWVDHRVKERW